MTERRAATVHLPRTRRIGFGTPEHLQLVGQVAAAVTGLIGACSVLGWVFGVAQLRSVLPEMDGIRFNTAAGLLLLALSWFVPRAVRLVALWAAALICLLSLAEYAAGTSLGIDQLIVTDPSTGGHPGRMAVATAASILALLVAGVLADRDRFASAQVLASLVLMLQFLTLLAYAYDLPLLDNMDSIATGAAMPAIGLVLLALAVLTSVPTPALWWVSDVDDAGAMLVRRLLPVALVGVPLVGGLVLLGERHELYGAGPAVALVVLAGAIVVGLVSWDAGRRLSRVDRGRAQAITELTDLKLDLEQQVVERATQLRERRDEIAVLQDRQRIAADLHDVVIQRLFAAGMFLQGTSEDDPPGTKQRLDAALEAMDGAIKDLRTSIFELGGADRPAATDFAPSLYAVIDEAARMLGFRPELTIDDPEQQAAAFRDDLLAVVREALANVARHAGARHVEVALRVGGGVLALTVADDGRGMGGAAGHKGTRNMVQRARDHGGNCTWAAMQPRGTRMRWTVPLA